MKQNPKIGIQVVLAAALLFTTGCTKQMDPGEGTLYSDVQILTCSELASDEVVAAKNSSRAAADPTREMTFYLVRADETGQGTGVYGAYRTTPISAVRAAGTGATALSFATPQYYLVSNAKTRLTGWYPAATSLVGSTVKWTIDGATDILTAPEQGGSMSVSMSNLVFNHALSQVQIHAYTPDANAQATWGTITKIELVQQVNTCTYDFATNGATGAVMPEIGTTGTFTVSNIAATTIPIVLAAQVGDPVLIAPQATATVLKLEVTTSKLGKVEVLMPAGVYTQGKAYILKLKFNAFTITATASIGTWQTIDRSEQEVMPPLPPTTPNPPAASDIVTIDGLQWTKGNLVAVDGINCKVGSSTDYGVYFQFGSLVGWTGGASGDGTGQGEPGLGVQVQPSTYGGTDVWGTVGRYLGGTTDDKGYNLPATDAPTTGIGDPCRFYLGAPWRTPTAGEYKTLFANVNNGTAWGSVPGWNWQASPAGAIGPSSLFFPASGYRGYDDGSVNDVTTNGFGWSSSVYTATHGYNLRFYQPGGVVPQNNYNRSTGLPVRCVSGTYVPPPTTTPNPPAASDIVTIDGLQWTKGNLVAVDGANCKVGSSTDYGVYFQFGSLVGWNGGATGNGVGTGEPSLGVQVKPSTYVGTDVWTTVGRYTAAGTSGTGYGLPATDAPTTGIGDPCRFYLGAPWRTPTAVELASITGKAGSSWIAWTIVTGRWVTSAQAFDGVSGPGAWFGTPLSAGSGTPSSSVNPFFPASGHRDGSSGSFYNVTSLGYYWSSSVYNATHGYYLYFYQPNGVIPQDYNNRSTGFPVRCVSGSYVPPPPTNPPTASDIVTIDGLQWTKGNLVAKNTNECKVGAPGDYGVYFQFGSLVGWSGGASGDGTGQGEPALGVQVKPSTYVGTDVWGTVGRYLDGTTDDKGYNLPATDAPTTGIGDPCRFYLGAPWRTPTAGEYKTLFANVNNDTAWGSVPGWNWQASPAGAIGPSSLFFPASGYRSTSNGSFYNVTTYGSGWSSSVNDATLGLSLYFNSSWVYPQSSNTRSTGFPVRCVSSVP